MLLLFNPDIPNHLVECIKLLYRLSSFQDTEIRRGDLNEDALAGHTVIFMLHRHKKGIDPAVVDLYKNGYRVFTYKKPYHKSYSPFKFGLTLLANWKGIVDVIHNNSNPFVYTLQENRNRPTKLIK